jgi:hypothetical protein
MIKVFQIDDNVFGFYATDFVFNLVIYNQIFLIIVKLGNQEYIEFNGQI